MKAIKKFLNRLFIDGLSGMAFGLFATLIIGTILQQIGTAVGTSAIGTCIFTVGKIASSLMGAGIGCGVAVKFGEKPLVTLSAAACGMVGAFAGKILDGSLLDGAIVKYAGPGEPMGAFVAAFVGIELGHLIAGKTKLDIVLTPIVTIGAGSSVGLLVGPYISQFMTWLGSVINWGTEQSPILMGVVVSVLMGIALTLPISSAAIGIALNLSGIAAGAAVAGCCANMIGFAVASYRDNGFGGLLAQGVGTSMLQMPNIVKKPIIWLPAIIASAVTGPISSKLLGMVNNATGSGMGTAGLVGQIMGYQAMTQAGVSPTKTLIEMAIVHFLLPAIIAFGVSEGMRKLGLIKKGDMKLEI
ncbi:MAG TPA: PTS sugar transporter subunit IIC [Ruminococcaceae bacterium]|nr:PTS sugar transporter subunit IIC [Oscillospiraceae bacterium]